MVHLLLGFTELASFFREEVAADRGVAVAKVPTDFDDNMMVTEGGRKESDGGVGVSCNCFQFATRSSSLD